MVATLRGSAQIFSGVLIAVASAIPASGAEWVETYRLEKTDSGVYYQIIAKVDLQSITTITLDQPVKRIWASTWSVTNNTRRLYYDDVFVRCSDRNMSAGMTIEVNPDGATKKSFATPGGWHAPVSASGIALVRKICGD